MKHRKVCPFVWATGLLCFKGPKLMEINVPNGWTPKAPEFGAIALFGGGFHQAALQTSNGGHQILSKAVVSFSGLVLCALFLFLMAF